MKNILRLQKRSLVNLRNPKKATTVKPTALASQLIFKDNSQQSEDVLTMLKSEVDEKLSAGKRENIEIDVDGVKFQIKAELITEKITTDLTDEEDFGGVIYADVNSPDETINVINTPIIRSKGCIRYCF